MKACKQAARSRSAEMFKPDLCHVFALSAAAMRAQVRAFVDCPWLAAKNVQIQNAHIIRLPPGHSIWSTTWTRHEDRPALYDEMTARVTGVFV